MRKEDYIKTIIVCKKEIKLGMDDYGQCFYIEWVDDNGKIQEESIGTYNTHYMEYIYHKFDPKYKELSRKEMFGEATKHDLTKLEKYYKIFEEEYNKKENQ